MANLRGLESVVSQLRVERTSLLDQLRHVDAALSVLGKLNNGRSYTKPRRRRLSAAPRRKIAPAHRARWAKVRQLKKAANQRTRLQLYPPKQNLARRRGSDAACTL
jgi:hypothetical protein